MQFKYGKIRTIISLFRFLSAASALSSPLMIRSTTETWFFMAKEQMPFASFVQRLIGVCIRSTILFTASRDITSVSCSRMLYTFKPCKNMLPRVRVQQEGRRNQLSAFQEPGNWIIIFKEQSHLTANSIQQTQQRHFVQG